MTDAGFREEAADDRVEAVALSHLSLELGHLYMDDYLAGTERLLAQFGQVRPWVEAARSVASATTGTQRPRVSTCFLIDDYFTRFSSPAKVLPDVIAAALECGLTIDYIARESACATADGVPLTEIVAGRLTALPPPGTNGSRPPALEIGWLSNGQRSPGSDAREAMNRPTWLPPVETDAPNHSIFVDVEMWTETAGRRTWSCAYLASVWQLLRLGMLRNAGQTVLRPVSMTEDFPDGWDDLPPVVQVEPSASPFCAYRSLSVIPARFLAVEHAVRVILGQYSALPAVIDQIAARSGREHLELPPTSPNASTTSSSTAADADSAVLVFGEVRTCLLQNSAAANQNDVATLLRFAPGERVRASERPVAHAVSPELVSGVDCRMPAASGAHVRGVGTVMGRAVVTGGRVLQGSTFTRLERGQSDRRMPWSHYLARPGVVQTVGGFDRTDVTTGFLTEPQPTTTVDLGALSGQLIRQVQANARLDHVSPFKSRRTRLKWIASIGGPTDGEFTITDDNARTFRVSCPAMPVRSVVELCEDLAMHDWVLTTVLRIVERSQIGTLTGAQVLTRLRPAIDHLLHLWMPGARVATVLLPFWESIERRPGFSLQWQATVFRIRDQLAVHTLETLSRLSPTMTDHSP